MRRWTALAATAALLLVTPAFAGGGYGCQNACPLAQQANTHRSLGKEAVAVSATLQADRARTVTRNLARI